MSYLRLRQLCLVAEDVEAQAAALCAAFGLAEAYRDPHLAKFGLRNIMLPVGAASIFLELVSPIRPGTAAGRYLERRGGPGGYMVICDCADWEGARARAEAMGLRVIHQSDWTDAPRAQAFQLHPKDTGGTMLEFDRHGAGEDMLGPYRWAGPDWQAAIRPGPVERVLGVDIQSDRAEALAASWSRLFAAPLGRAPDGAPRLTLDNAFIRFTPEADRRGEGLAAIHLRTPGAPPAGEVTLCGVRFVLT